MSLDCVTFTRLEFTKEVQSQMMIDNFTCFDSIGLKEVNTNHLASTYITDNYNKIIAQVRKMGVPADRVDDLVHDVFISIYNAEANGEGYDTEYSAGDTVITPAEFVFGRLRGYAKNDKYKNIYSERRTVSHAEDCVEVFAASTNGEDYDNMDSFQKAYASAAAYNDDIDSVELRVSLKQNIETCRDFNSVVGFDMLNLFKNMDMFQGEFNSSLFENLRKSMAYHTELGEAFKAVMEASMMNRNDLEIVLESFN